MIENIYRPFKVIISEIKQLSENVRLFRLKLDREIDYLPAQFFMLGVWGAGEVPISVASTSRDPYIEFGIRKVGKVTGALHELKAGEAVWMRGPFGNGFDLKTAHGRDIIFVAGGIGILPLRALINHILMERHFFGRLFLIYGSKRPSEMLFSDEIPLWKEAGIDVILTVDIKDGLWRGYTGVVTEHIDRIRTDFREACSYICGPEVMIENTVKELSLRGMPDHLINISLERRMKCGIGKCGQCYHGIEYICINGPVYTYEDIKKRLALYGA